MFVKEVAARMIFRSMIAHYVRGLLVLAVLPVCLLGQDDSDTRRRSPRVQYEKFSVGGRVVYLITGQVSEGTDDQRNNDTNPPTLFFSGSKPEKDTWGFGVGAQFNIAPKIGITGELITRSVKFKTETRINREATLTRNRQLIANEFLTTSATYWDIPITMRYYLVGPRHTVRPFLSGGISARLVRDPMASREIINVDNTSESDTFDVTPQVENDQTFGAVGGIGLELIDDLNLKLTIEGRYTRWQNRVFGIGLANALSNQVEIYIGLSY